MEQSIELDLYRQGVESRCLSVREKKCVFENQIGDPRPSHLKKMEPFDVRGSWLGPFCF